MAKYKVRVMEDRDFKYDVEVTAAGVGVDNDTGYLMFWENGTTVASFATFVYMKELKDEPPSDR